MAEISSQLFGFLQKMVEAIDEYQGEQGPSDESVRGSGLLARLFRGETLHPAGHIPCSTLHEKLQPISSRHIDLVIMKLKAEGYVGHGGHRRYPKSYYVTSRGRAFLRSFKGKASLDFSSLTVWS